MTPRKHADLIKAWADGAEIEYWDTLKNEWTDPCGGTPTWAGSNTYRIKPTPKPDITKTFLLESHVFAGLRFTEEIESSRLPRQQWIKAIFDGETAIIKSVEVLHE